MRYIAKESSYGRVHPKYGLLSADTKTGDEDWGDNPPDWIPIKDDAAVVAEVEAAPFEKTKKKSKPEDAGEEF